MAASQDMAGIQRRIKDSKWKGKNSSKENEQYNQVKQAQNVHENRKTCILNRHYIKCHNWGNEECLK